MTVTTCRPIFHKRLSTNELNGIMVEWDTAFCTVLILAVQRLISL